MKPVSQAPGRPPGLQCGRAKAGAGSHPEPGPCYQPGRRVGQRGGGGKGPKREAAVCSGPSRSRVPGPAVGALQGEALGLARRCGAGRAAQVGAVGRRGMPRGVGVLGAKGGHQWLQGRRAQGRRAEGRAGGRSAGGRGWPGPATDQWLFVGTKRVQGPWPGAPARLQTGPPAPLTSPS